VPVDPVVLRGRFDHGVLAGDLVGPDRHAAGGGDVGEYVEEGAGRFDHHRIGAFGDVEFCLAQSFAPVGGVELVAAPVAGELGVGRLPEGAVEGGGVLGGVGEYGDVGVARPVERVTDGGHLAVHHPGQSEQLGSCLCLGEGDGGVAGQGGVVVD